MSWQASKYVKDLDSAPNGQPLTRPEKTVLAALAYHHNEDHGYAWPSYKLLAAETKYNRRHIIRICQSLVAKKILVIQKALDGFGDLTSNHYYIVGHARAIPEADDEESPVDRGVSPMSPPSGAMSPPSDIWSHHLVADLPPPSGADVTLNGRPTVDPTVGPTVVDVGALSRARAADTTNQNGPTNEDDGRTDDLKGGDERMVDFDGQMVPWNAALAYMAIHRLLKGSYSGIVRTRDILMDTELLVEPLKTAITYLEDQGWIEMRIPTREEHRPSQREIPARYFRLPPSFLRDHADRIHGEAAS